MTPPTNDHRLDKQERCDQVVPDLRIAVDYVSIDIHHSIYIIPCFFGGEAEARESKASVPSGEILKGRVFLQFIISE